jgi:hypothetical protein
MQQRTQRMAQVIKQYNKSKEKKVVSTDIPKLKLKQ